MMTTLAGHPFHLRGLNVRDENGNETCAFCGRPRDHHRRALEEQPTTLFPDLVPVVPVPGEPHEKVSAGRRLTLRQKADIAAGRHPLTRGPINPARTCGQCAHRIRNHRGYPKCDLSTMTHSAASDVRAYWPACTTGFEPISDQPTSRRT